MIPNSLRPVSLPLRPGSRSSTVRRSSLRSLPTPDSWSIARTGRSRKRFDIPAAVAISFRPMPVIWSTFLPNSGEAASSAISSETNPSTFSSSADFFSVSIATRPAAFSGRTIGTGSGGVSSSSIPGAVAVLVVVWVVVAIRCPLPASTYCIKLARHAVQGRPLPGWPEPAATGLQGEGSVESRRPCPRPPGRAVRARTADRPRRSGEDSGDRLDFRRLGGEDVGEQQRRNGDRADGGEGMLGVVRKDRHLHSPCLVFRG